MTTPTGEFLLDVYRRLFDAYGPQHWWPGAETPIEVCVGAILTQSAAWTNVEMAMKRLRDAGRLSLSGIHEPPQEELAELVRSSGYFNVKARKLKAFAQHVYDHHNGDLDAMVARSGEELRAERLGVYGIGEETADDIVLYAANAPSFVVDAYTRRILTRLGAPAPEDTYQSYRRLFMDALPPDAQLYNEYHALLDNLGKEVCRKRAPRCAECPLLDLCPTGLERAHSL
jgi:endonuclease-3 related protein